LRCAGHPKQQFKNARAEIFLFADFIGHISLIAGWRSIALNLALACTTFLDRLLDEIPDQDAHGDQDERESEQLVWNIHA
jgi:hypothetical protein